MKLILRAVTSPYDDITKGSVLSHQELDTNQINLKGELIYTANSENNVITFQKINGGTIEVPFSGGGDTYTNLSATTATVGGIVQGSTFVSQTMTQMFDALLYPYQNPGFNLFYLDIGISSPLEMGYDITTNQTFRWSTSNSSNVSANTVSIAGYNLTTINGLANDGLEPVTFTSNVTRGAADGVGTRAWSIQALNTKSNVLSTSSSISWHWIMYVGTSTNTSLTENNIKALTNFNSVKNGFAGTYTMSAGGYKYFCFATTYGTPTIFVDTLNNLNIGMYGGYPNIDAQGNSYDLVSVTNGNGETTNYKVYRTLNILSSTITIAVN
jgi:hypothetical protein